VCTSCDNSAEPKCSWKGWSVYNANNKCWQLHASGAHGVQQTKAKRPLTAEQEDLLMESQARNVQGRLVALNHTQRSPPSKKQARSFHKNKRFRQKLASRSVQLPEATDKEEWTVEDIMEALRKHTVDAVGIDPASLEVDPDQLLLLGTTRWVEEKTKRPGFAAVLSTKQILSTPQRLDNKRYIKIACDATFRELFGNWCTVNVGVLTKHWGETVVDTHEEHVHKATTWATTYSPLVYVMASSEAGPAVELGLKAIGEIKIDDSGAKMGPRIRQMHQDWAKQQESARQHQMSVSVCAKDFRHAIEKIKENLPAYLQHRNDDGEKKYYKDILRAIRRSRTHCTTLTEFHHFWHYFFDQLQHEWDEAEAADYLQRTYFFGLPRDIAREQYGVHYPIGEGDVICAAWWGAYCRLQPGSASGTQALEAFHAHEFHSTFVDSEGKPLTHLDIDGYLSGLQGHVLYRGRQSRKTDSTMPDRPAGPDPLSKNSTGLQNVGRSTAKDLWEAHRAHTGVVQEVETPLFGTAHVMPRSLLRKRSLPDQDEEWEPVPIQELITPPDMAKDCVNMATEGNGRQLRELWWKSGILIKQRRGRTGFSLARWAHYRYHRVVVLGNPLSCRYWHSPGCDLRLCSCTPFAICGHCEHEHLADCFATDAGALDVPGNQRRGRPCHMNFATRGVSARVAYHTASQAEDAPAVARGPAVLQPGLLALHRTDNQAVPLLQPARRPNQTTRDGELPPSGAEQRASGPRAPYQERTDATDEVLRNQLLAGREVPHGGKMYFNRFSQAESYRQICALTHRCL